MPSERQLKLRDRLPDCPVRPAPPGGLLDRIPSWRDRLVLDHGCGDAHRRRAVEARGGTYVGLDPYSSASDLLARGDRIPLADASIDAVISNAVLHLVPDPRTDVLEIGRVMKAGGWLVGYVGFLEGDAEHARFLFSHLALAETLENAGLELAEISVSSYGLDLQAGGLAFPYATFPAGQRAVRLVVRELLSAWMGVLAALAAWRASRRGGPAFGEARRDWRTWLDVSHAAGFEFTARKRGAGDPVSGPRPVDWAQLLRCPVHLSPLRRVARSEIPGLPSDAEPAAREWLVDDAGHCAFPVLGSQLALEKGHAVSIA